MALSLEEKIRIDLAATFRIIAHLGMHEAVANHFSAAVSADGKQFLLNPKWKHFSRIRASDLLLLNADDASCADNPNVDATAWSIHGQIHRLLPSPRGASLAPRLHHGGGVSGQTAYPTDRPEHRTLFQPRGGG